MSEVLKNPSRWTPDCQGKQDFDGFAVLILSRYWPGPMTVFDTAHPEKGLHEIPGRGPSANSQLCIQHKASDDEGLVVLVERDFMGETEADVKRLVEEWVQQQFERMVAALRREFDR